MDAAVEFGRVPAGFGLRSLWFGQTVTHDTITPAALVGRAVPELEVGTSVVPVPGRHPLLVAGQAQTAQAATAAAITEP